MQDWRAEAERLRFDEGYTWTELADAMLPLFPGKSWSYVRNRVRDHIRKTDRYQAERGDEPVKKSSATIMQQAIDALRAGTTIDKLAEELGLSGAVTASIVDELRGQGYNILTAGDEIKISTIVVPSQNISKREWTGERIIRFGLMGDTQINSKYTQITHLHKLYDFYQSEGIETVYHTGDMDEGEEMRIGHKYECYTQGADDHEDEIVRVYPRRPGITTYFITGNHDHSIIKRAGYDIGRAIERRRDDMVYLGQSSAIVGLTDNCTLELRHPGDGTAYALSYKIQKMVEAMSGGEKPNILAVGHYHKQEYLFYRNVHCFQTGCLQAQTPFMRGRSIAAMMGGWIVEVIVNDSGVVERVRQEFMPFYRGIPEDYKNWQ